MCAARRNPRAPNPPRQRAGPSAEDTAIGNAGRSDADHVSPATALRRAWAGLPPRLRILEPVEPSAAQWPVLERLHAGFDDRGAQICLPMPLARFRAVARQAILETARRLDDVETEDFEGGARHPGGPAPAPARIMADFARRFAEDVDTLMRALVPAARYRKGHYAYGRFTVAEPHGLHTDHSAEDPGAAGEPICIARVGTLGTHFVAGDARSHDAQTERMLGALRHWVAVPEGEPEAVLAELLKRGTLGTIPVDHVILMVAGNASATSQPTQHIAARPPEGGLHSAFFQRQYRLA